MTDQERQLQQRIAELEQQLVKAEPLRSLGAMAGGVAHRFNGLLSVILGNASYVLNRENLSDGAAHALQDIVQAAQKGRHVTDELLAFSTQEGDTEEICSVHETLQSVLTLISSQYHSSLELTSDLAAEQDRVSAPTSSIWQLVFSLLSNAADSLQGGGRLKVVTKNTVMEDDSGERCIAIEVTEEGGTKDMAVTEEELRQSGKVSTMSAIVGTLQGAVTVSVEPGRSSVINVLLPVQQQSDTAVQSDAITDAAAGSQSIWVVDDDAIFCQMCERVLVDEGHTVQVIENGNGLMKAWKAAREKPALLLIDFSMTDHNGLELCEWLRKNGASASVILVSGFSAHQPDIHKALQDKSIHFLQKPFGFQDLIDLVQTALT